MSVDRMLARQLAPWRDVLLAAPDDAALLPHLFAESVTTATNE